MQRSVCSFYRELGFNTMYGREPYGMISSLLLAQ